MIFGILAFAYIGIGIAMAVIAYRLPRHMNIKIAASSFVCALFFSLSLVAWRLAFPLPTLLVIIAEIIDGIDRLQHPDAIREGTTVIALPLLIQWSVWWLIFKAFHFIKYRRNKTQGDTV